MKRTKKLLLAGSVVPLLMSVNTFAGDSIDQRVALLEQELRALRNELKKTQIDTVQVKKKTLPNTSFSFGGFIKADAMWSDYSAGSRATASVGDDFLVPSTIPVGGKDGDSVFDTSAKTSRIWFKTVSNTSVGQIKSYMEMDFNSSADERLTNQSSNGLRHAFVDWKYSDSGSILAGQTWSTFFNVGALPEMVDFIGPTSGSLFIRQPILRWTKKLSNGGSLMLSAENPETSLYDGGIGFSDNRYDNNNTPDLVVRYNDTLGDLNYSISAIGRQISYSDSVTISDNQVNTTISGDDKTNGFAVSLAGKYGFENGDDLKFMLSSGNLGRYMALNSFRDGAIEADGDIDLIDVTGGFVAYRHFWSPKWRSTLSWALSEADNSDYSSETVNKRIENGNLNLMYSPTKGLTFGAEYIYAKRELENGDDGDLKRLQFMAKYAF